MIYKSFKDISLSRLGMGNMRLPVRNDLPNHPIDYDKAAEIIDYAMAHGINYYDTAYVYHNGESEVFLGKCLCGKYPRDSFYVTDKFYILADPDYKKVFEEQLRRLNTDHIDFYLIHCLTDGTIDQLLSSGALEYFLEEQKKGRITYFGFSSHASVETLERFASHHQWDFAQIQFNYYDYCFGTAKKEYEVLKAHNIPIMVMESVRGGRLSVLTPETEKRLKEARPDDSISSWAFRWLMGQSQVQVCLSGMTTLDQIKDNVHTFEKYQPLSEEENALLMDVVAQFKSQIVVPCTSCRYCCDTCPMQINIPEFLKLYNTYKVDGLWALQQAAPVDSVGTPKDCIACGACTGHCPQNIDTPKIMAELAKVMK